MTDIPRCIQDNDQRDRDVCAYYVSGQHVSACCKKFALSRDQIQRILRAAGVWKPYVKSGREAYLGVWITHETKRALLSEAARRSISVSRMVSDLLNALVASR